MLERIKARPKPDRSKINMQESQDVKFWTRKLSVDRERLQQVIDKVGDSAAAVRKELAGGAPLGL
jgi:predicted RNA-binding protein YlqC (UPF0109 family)